MMKNGKTLRMVLNGVLLLAIIALGVTVYQAGTKDRQDQAQLEESAPEQENFMDSEEDTVPMVDAGTSEVQAELGTDDIAEETAEVPEETGETKEEESAEESLDTSAQGTGIEVNFTEDSLMGWPLNGELVMDYNMENTVYFPTLNQYKLSSAIAVKSDVGAPVSAAANGIVTSVLEEAQTGLTVTMDLGNGYEAVYGQLKDLTVEEGQTVAFGSIIGYVNEPSKYYSTEGSNLYFAMKKDGEPIDPIAYLP